MADRPAGNLARLERAGTAVENALLVVLLAAMMLLAVGQIGLRIFFSFGFVWTDELIKLMVLWIAMIASVAASRNNRHLRIDVLSHFVPEGYALFPRLVVDVFAAVVCGVLAWQSWRYVQLSIEFEETVLVGVAAWKAYAVVPVSFGLMCYHFSLGGLSDLGKIIKLDAGKDTEA